MVDRQNLLGRDADERAIRVRLDRSRLVTLTGPPGVGKTRLARAVADAVVASSGARLVRIDLAGVSTVNDALDVGGRAVARALRRSDGGLRELDAWGVPRWAGALAGLGPLFVVLDECESSLEGAVALAELVLESSDTASLLATSRERLGLPEEEVHALGGLALEPAVELLRRFRAHDDAEGLADIATKIDCLPIALDLAARLLETLSVAELRARLAQPALILPIERTLRSSWTPLADDLRATLTTAAIFQGPFTVEWLETVVDPALRARAAILVDGLVKKSLVVRDPVDTGPTLRVLATVRGFVVERAKEARAFAEVEVAFQRGLALLGSRSHPAETTARLTGELIAAVESRLEQAAGARREGDDLTLELLASVAEALRFQGHNRRLGQLLARGLAAVAGASNPLAVVVRVHFAKALAADQRLQEATREAERALAEAVALGDRLLELGAANVVAETLVRAGREESARRALDRTDAIANELGGATTVLDQIAARVSLEWRSGSAEAAFRESVRGLAAAQAANADVRVAQFRGLVGQTSSIARRDEEGYGHLERAAADADRLGAHAIRVAMTTSMGLSRVRSGDLERAAKLLDDAAALAREHGLVRAALWAEAYGGAVEALSGGRLARLEDSALRIDLDEPLLLLIPLFAAIGGSHVARSLLDEGLQRIERERMEGSWLPGYVAACRAAVAGERERMRREADRLPPAFVMDFVIADRLVGARTDRAVEARPTLFVALDASWFRWDDGEPVSLGTSSTAKLLFRALVDARRTAPGRGLTIDELREAAWPGDRSRRDAAANRVYVAINRLRDRGLRAVLVRADTGWLLLPETEVTVVEARNGTAT